MTAFWNSKDVKFREQHTRPARAGFVKFWENLTDDQKDEYAQKRARKQYNPQFYSKLEARIANVLQVINIPYRWCFWVKNRSYDFRIEGTKTLIEVNGDYWHANPCIYKGDDQINHPDGYVLASQIWKRDADKRFIAESYGYRVVYVWEAEIKGKDDDFVTEIVLKRIGELSTKIP